MLARQTINGIELVSALPEKPRHKAPLLFVHGAFTGAWVWEEHFLPWFADAGFAAHALSLSGHGNSVGGERIDWLSIGDYVADLNGVAAALAAPPVLIGHSMGGFVVQKYLETHRAAAAVLMCSVPPQGLLAAQFSMLLEKPDLLLEINRLLGGGAFAYEALREALFAQEVDSDTMRRYYRLMQPESTRAIWDMSLFNLPCLRAERLPPLLVLGAGKDALVPPFLVNATARTYGVSAHVFPDLGHGMMLEKDWATVAEHIAAWLRAAEE